MIKAFFIALGVMLSSSLWAMSLQEQAAIPGGVVIVPLSASDLAKPVVRYGKKPVAVVESDGQWVAVVGVPLGAKVGTQRLTVTQSGRTSRALF